MNQIPIENLKNSRSVRNGKDLAIAFVLAGLYLIFLLICQFEISVTVDECRWIDAGKRLMSRGMVDDADLFAHPILFMYSQALSRQLFSTGAYDSDVTWARVGIYPYTILGVLVFCLMTIRRNGRTGGIISCLFLIFCPTFLAHARLATSDAMVASAVFCTVAAFSALILKNCFLNQILFTLSLLFGMLSKFSFFLALIICVIYWLLFVRKQHFMKEFLRNIIIPVTASLIILNACYGFKGSFGSLRSFHLASSGLQKLSGTWFGVFPLPLPQYYLKGMDEHLAFSLHWRAYLFGELSEKGFAGYDLIAFFCKTTTPAIFLIALSIIFIRRGNLAHLEKLSLVMAIGWLTYFSFLHRIDCGVRYVLPVYPLLYYFAGRLTQIRITQNIRGQTVAIVLLIFHFISCLGQFPFYISFFNILCGGGSNGFKLLSDSNIVWLEEMKGLRTYQKTKNVDRFIFGLEKRYNLLDPYIEYRPIKHIEKYFPGSGVFVVNVTSLQLYLHEDPNAFLWCRLSKPDAIIARSSYIYHMNIKPGEGLIYMRDQLQRNIETGFSFPWAKTYLNANNSEFEYPFELPVDRFNVADFWLDASELPPFGKISIAGLTDDCGVDVIGMPKNDNQEVEASVEMAGDKRMCVFPNERAFQRIHIRCSQPLAASCRICVNYSLK